VLFSFPINDLRFDLSMAGTPHRGSGCNSG